MAKPADIAEIRVSLDQLAEMYSRRDELQRIIVEWLIYQHGGLRKAAAAVGEQPSNFSNLRSGKRRASLQLLRRFIVQAESKPPDAGRSG